MLGNLFRESLVVNRLSNTAQNELINIVTIFLATCVGATMQAKYFLTFQTIKIIILGLIAFAFSTAGGVLFGKLLNKITGGKINPYNWCCRSICSTYGRKSGSESRSGSKSKKLFINACYGP
jgi:Na+-transporting methylmalonyl-CoA/oxaloacetate decarboxylase beta subunit